MNDPTILEIADLIAATGLPQSAVARFLDVQPTTLNRWLAGTQKIQHPAMLRKALQMIVLENKGMISERLVDTVAPQSEMIIGEVLKANGEIFAGHLQAEHYLNSPPKHWYYERDYRNYFARKQPAFKAVIGDGDRVGRVIQLTYIAEPGQQEFAIFDWKYFRRLTDTEIASFTKQVVDAIDAVKAAAKKSAKQRS